MWNHNKVPWASHSNATLFGNRSASCVVVMIYFFSDIKQH